MRSVVKFLFGLVVVFAIAWVGLWWYAEGRLENGFTAWASQLATQGWKIGYTSDQRGTSPTAASLTLTGLTLSPPPDAQGRTGTITLPSLTLRIEALNPLVLHTDLPAKINLDFGAGIDAAVSFATVSSTQQLDPHVLFSHGEYPYRSGNFAATGVDILASQGSLLVLHMDNVATQYSLNPQAAADGNALSVTESFDGIAVSPLMTRMLSIPFGGKITHLGMGLNVSGPVPDGLTDLAAQLKAVPFGDEAAQQKLLIPVLHQWAVKGGSGNFSFTSLIGPSTLTAAASVKFDDSVQPEGTADITADHLDQFTGAITNAYPAAQDDIAQIEAQLSQYLTTTSEGGQTLTMHVVYGSRSVSVNGQKIGPLPPVDWTALENPPPAPPAGTDTPDDDNDNGSGAAPDSTPTPPDNNP